MAQATAQNLAASSTDRLIPDLVGQEQNEIAEQEGKSPTDSAPARKNPARKVAAIILLVLVGSTAWHVVTDLVVPTSSTGSVAALTALVAPRAAGQVQQVLVQDNQFVKAGETLFTLDPAPFALTVRQAEANLAQAVQTVEASVVSLASAEAKVAQARANFENSSAAAERAKSLFDRGLSAQSQYDTIATQLASAQATLDASVAELESARMKATGIETNPQIQAAQVQLEQAKLNLAFATVTAPTDGVVTNLKLAVGQYVNTGSPTLTFIESGSLWVVVDMRENQLANVDVGDEADLLFDALPGRKYPGVVRGVAWGIDPGRTAANGLPQNQAMARWFEPARTIPVHIELAAGEDWPANARVGSKVNALVYAEGRGNPVAWGAGAMQSIVSWFSYLY